MWNKFNNVLGLGEEWANEDGVGEWIFNTNTKISVRFKSVDDRDELDGILDSFEDATDDEKRALRNSLNDEGYVSYFSFTVITPSGEEYYFNQLTGGGGEPVVEDFFCDEERQTDISSALDEILSSGESPKPNN